MLMNRQNAPFSRFSYWPSSIDLLGDKLPSSSYESFNPAGNIRGSSDSDAVLNAADIMDDLFLHQDEPSVQFPFTTSNQFIQSSPQIYASIVDGSGLIPDQIFDRIPNEQAQEAPPPYDAVKDERFTESPQSSHSDSIPFRGMDNRPSRFSAGPYGKYKDDSGKIDINQIPDESERKKVLEKREKNRVAASRARNRKREKTELLEEEKAAIEKNLQNVLNETQRLQNVRNKLRVVANEHEKLCPFLSKSYSHR